MLDLRTFTKIAGPITLILLLGNSRESVAQLSPIQLQPYFKQDEFTACLAEEFAKNETPVKLRARLQEIDRQRTDLSSSTPHACKAVLKGMCQIIGISIADRVASYLEPVGCYMNDQIDKSLTNHSVALVKCPVPSIVQGVPFLSDLTEWEFLTRPAFPDLNQVSDLRGAVEQFAKAKVIRLSRPAADQKECVQNLAEPLAKWLLKNKFQSVSHWELLSQAIEIYKDPFAALGVIGEMFDYERQTCKSRSKACVLGNKMKPFFPDGVPKYKNPLGENYHFWAQLNAALTENSYKEKAANYLLEWKKNQDSGEYSANSMGINIGYKSVFQARQILSTLSPVPRIPKSCH